MHDFTTWLRLLRADASRVRCSLALRAIPATFLCAIHANGVPPEIEAIKTWAEGDPERLLKAWASAVPAPLAA
jgi:hypothetical protein